MKKELSIFDSTLIESTARAMGAGESLTRKVVDQAKKHPNIAKTALFICDPGGGILLSKSSREIVQREVSDK